MVIKRKLISVKLDVIKFLKGQREGIFHLKVRFPKEMPKEEVEDIKKRLNQIVNDIKKYL